MITVSICCVFVIAVLIVSSIIHQEIYLKKTTILRDPKLNRHRFGDSTITIYSDALGEVS